MTTLGILLFAFAILFSIGLHEFGHFITAKRFGIKVEQFFIGFGPKLWSTTRGETEYGVKALPLGGFVRIAGMNPFEEVAPEDHDRVFKAKKPWQRAIVLSAGSFTHFVVALFIIAAILSISGVADPNRPTTTVANVSATLGDAPAPAAVAGFQVGDELVSVDGRKVDTWQEAVALIQERAGRTVPIVVRRDGVERTLQTPIADHKPDGTKTGFVGIGPDFARVKRSPLAALGEAGKQIGFGAQASLSALGDLFSPSSLSRLFAVASGRQERRPEDPATVIGISNQAGRLAGEGDFSTLFYLIAGFNIFIGVANLLPLPPLDGGHLAVLAYEKARRREVDMRRLIPVSATVISLFGSLFLLLLYLDIVKPLPAIPG